MEFMVTFGQKYRQQEHPVLYVADPDGWVTVVADDEDDARAQVRKVLGESWSGLYRLPSGDEHFYPHGEFARIEHGELVR